MSPLRLPVSPLRHARDYIDGGQNVKLKSVDKPQMRMLKGQRNSRSIIGGVAQLGERLNGIQEASSSILLISTKKIKREEHDNRFFPFYMIFS